MFIVGFVTADEAIALIERGYEVEDASSYGLVSPHSIDRTDGDAAATGRDSYLMAKPEPGPDATQAVSIFVDAAVYDLLKADLFTEEQVTAFIAQTDSETPAFNSLDIETFAKRKLRLRTKAYAMRDDAENHHYCSHKNPDGSDARYPIGNGELGCICGNKWD